MSYICLGNFKTDNMPLFSHAVQNTSYISTADCSILDEEPCTLEILGNAYISLLNHQTAACKSESHKKSETQFFMLQYIETLQRSLFKFYTSDCSVLSTDTSDIAGTINFIHDKDGKKRI